MNISLVMVTEGGKSKELPTLKLPITIGRAETAKLRVPVASVSRAHCELVIDDDELVVKDLKSANGTYVNKERVKSRELIPGDLLCVGPVVFVVRIDGHPKAIDPIIAWANGAVALGEGSPSTDGNNIDGVPTWTSQSAPKAPAAKPPARSADEPRASGPAVGARPAAEDPKAGKKDQFDDLLADLSESDFDIDFGDDDEPKKK